MVKRFLVVASLALALTACQDDSYRSSGRHLAPIPQATMALMAKKGMSKNDPILVRAYKKESELEVWKRGGDGRYALLKTYPICRWSGQLGPKVREGDRQAPEGFYTVTPAQMNPNSSFYLSFDTGYPNTFDKSHGRTGSHLMVHGSCTSRGCFAMTDEAIAEIYALAREAFAGGQRGFQFQSLPFRMTPENLARYRQDQHIAFWKNLKEGVDYFEVTKDEPRIAVCNRRYVFGGQDVAQGNCSPVEHPAVAEKRQRDEVKVAELVAKGTPAVRLVYEDGGGHSSFRAAMPAQTAPSDGLFAVLNNNSTPRQDLGYVSRPEALAAGPKEILLDTAGKPLGDTGATAIAYASTSRPTAPAAASAPVQATVQAARPAAAPASAPTAAAPAVVANAAPSASVGIPTGERPLYRRVWGSLFGSEAEPAGAAPPATTASEPAAAPLPPRRKTSAAPSTPGEQYVALRTLPGSQPVLTSSMTPPR